MYGYALQRYGRDAVLTHVGVEPTGEAFNSIVLDEVANRPFNPMVNAGAIAVAELMSGQTARAANRQHARFVRGGSRRELTIDGRCSALKEATGTATAPSPYMMLTRHDPVRDPNECFDLISAMLGQRHLRDPRIHGGDAGQ